MVNDVDLMRELLFILETRQVSPRATIIFSIEDAAQALNRPPDAIFNGLGALQDLNYIDGPGEDEPGIWLFRKLTRKGIQFVRHVRNPRAWEKMKTHFANQRLEQGA